MRVSDLKNEKNRYRHADRRNRTGAEARVCVRKGIRTGQEDRKSVDETDIKGYSRSNSNSKRNINFSGWQR